MSLAPVPPARGSLAHADRVVPRPRRVYADVSVEAVGERWEVRLDGKPARTPGGSALGLPTHASAQLCAAEWRAQAREVDWAAMPATRLAFTTLDRAAVTRDGLAEEVARYAGSDGLAYWADAQPRLRERQAAEWGPVLAWAAEALGVALHPVDGIMPRPQPSASIARARALAAAEGDFTLTGLAFAAGLFGSTVLAFAVQRGRLTGEEAHALARLEEAHQEAEWGEDAEAAARTAARLEEARFIARWFAAAAAPSGPGS